MKKGERASKMCGNRDASEFPLEPKVITTPLFPPGPGCLGCICVKSVVGFGRLRLLVHGSLPTPICYFVGPSRDPAGVS